MANVLLCVIVILSACVTWAAAVAPLSMNDGGAVVRTEAFSECLSKDAQRFINATLITLSAESELDEARTALNASIYPRLMSRFMTHVTQSMAAGLSFCSAFARASTGLVGEWTQNRVPVPEHSYRDHCQRVMKATDDAAEYLFEGPAFRNGLYKCLRSVFVISSHVSTRGLK
jgi:hypothetical protein